MVNMFNFIVLMQPQQEGEGGGYSFLIMMALLILLYDSPAGEKTKTNKELSRKPE